MAALLATSLALAACGGGAQAVLEFEMVSDSGVGGTVTISEAGEQRTLVVVDVDPAKHPNMPAHIHPGTCADPVPQPRFPLQNVVDGMSTTEVPASLDELMSGEAALNLHRSNEDMQATACVDLRQAD
jgi:hypothetical protein